MRTLEQVHLKPNDLAAIAEASALVKARFPVSRVVLFGSKARGDDQDDSDIDLLLLTSAALNDCEKRELRHAIFALQPRWNVMFSPLCIPLKEWEEGIYQAMPLKVFVEQEGVEV